MRRVADPFRSFDPQRFLLWVPLASALTGIAILIGLDQVTPLYLAVLLGVVGYDLLALFGPARLREPLLTWAPQAYALCLLSGWLIALYVLPDHPITPMALLVLSLHMSTIYVFFFVRQSPRAAAVWTSATLLTLVLTALPHSSRSLSGNGAFDGVALPLTLLLSHGSLILVLLSLSRARAQLAGERAEARAMRELAYRDPLTGLHNRRKLELDLAELTARRSGSTGALLAVIDVDGLKSLNDTLGHAAGDDLLRRFAAGFARAAGPEGRAYRISGDEFALLLRPGTPGTAQRILETVTREVREVYPRAGASVGPAPQQRGETPSAWLSRADRAMYRHKRRTQEEAAPGR